MSLKFKGFIFSASLVFAAVASVNSYAGLPSGLGIPNPPSPPPVCAADGSACTFDGDCCQGHCKDFQVCESQLYCGAAGVACQSNEDCCDNKCDPQSNVCAVGVHH